MDGRDPLHEPLHSALIGGAIHLVDCARLALSDDAIAAFGAWVAGAKTRKESWPPSSRASR